MKKLFLTLGLVFIATDASAASVKLNISAKIINLTTVPIEEAIAFCDERNMACPALREKYEQASYRETDRKDFQNRIASHEGAVKASGNGKYFE